MAATLKTVAEACGVSHSTVSRALGDDPRISSGTRARVLAAARRCGYRPDARLSELMGQVRQGRRDGFQGTLTLMFLSGVAARRGEHRQIERYVRGVRERAEELGYGVDEFWLEAEGLKKGAVERMMRARGSRGAMLLQPRPGAPVEFGWDEFAWVCVGFFLEDPLLHTVAPDWSGDARRVTAALIAEGHREIGFVYNEVMDPVLGNAWLGGYAAEMIARGLETRVLRLREPSRAELKKQFAATRATALVLHSRTLAEQAAKAVPGVAVRVVNLGEGERWGTGVVTSCVDCGKNGVDVLVGQLRRGERGVPGNQKIVLAPGRWATAG